MKTCFNTITCGSDKPLEDTLDFAGKYGFDGVELESGRVDDYLTRHSLEDLKRALDKNRLKVAALMAFPFFCFDKGQQDAHVGRLDHYSKLATNLGAPTMLCFICDAPPPYMGIAEAIETAGRAAQRYGETSGQYGVKCALEAIGGSPFIPGPRQALAVASAAENDCVGIMIDTFHFYKSGVPLEDIRGIPKDQLLIVHVNDCPGLPLGELNDGHRLYTGLGVIPLVQEFRMLRDDIGYEGFLSVELFNLEYWADDHETVVRRSKEALDAVLAKV